MEKVVDYYPPAPANVPPDLATPTRSYRLRVIVVLTSLFLFVSLYVGLVVGSAYLCYYSFTTIGSDGPKPVTEAALDDLVKVEKQVTAALNQAFQQSQQGTMDDQRLLQVLERDVLIPWQELRERMAQIQNVPTNEQAFVQRVGQYLQQKEEGWELLARAIREDDRRLGEQAEKKMQQTSQFAQQLSAEAGRLVSRRPSKKHDGNGWLFFAGILSGLLFLFLVKGFFKRQQSDPSLRIEVTEKQQPLLFAFIRQLCGDTRAPFPHRVYLTPEVNASVFYHESFLSLFLPTPKNLVIGLGLVNRLNLSEFKAVLAHEFGHFSQNSMKLGSYVYTSNRVVGDLVYGRDWLDNLVTALRGTDIRIAIFAWAFTGVLWGLRKTLQGLFHVINFANVSLTREMEYNADLVAVSVTGSDALVHGLARLDFATDSLTQAWNDLSAAADHHFFTRDLFYHQTRAADYLHTLSKGERRGEPPALPDDPHQVVQVFPPEDTSVPKMWATHPSNHDREVNAKRRYIRSPIDERSPWVLFQDAPVACETVTRRLYKVSRKERPEDLQAPEVVQAFIDREHAETTYHTRYQGMYDHRYLTPGDPDELFQTVPAEYADAGRLAEAHAGLYGDQLKARMDSHQSRKQERHLLAGLAQGAVELKGKDFSFRGSRYRAADAKNLLDKVEQELTDDFDWMGTLDRQVIWVHDAMARQLGDAEQRELEARYRFHLALQEIHGYLSSHNNHVRVTLGLLTGKHELTEAEFRGTLIVLGQAHDALAEKLAEADGLALPSLTNLTPGEPLGPFLMSRPLISRMRDNQDSLDGEWIGRFLEQLGEVIDKIQRVHFKSLGGILALQERITECWAARYAIRDNGQIPRSTLDANDHPDCPAGDAAAASESVAGHQ